MPFPSQGAGVYLQCVSFHTMRALAPLLLRGVILLVPLIALLPIARLVIDWVEFAKLVEVPLDPLPPRGFDWVSWQDQDGEIIATFVYKQGPAYAAGLREGAALFQLEYQQFFSAEDVKRVIERSPVQELTYEVLQDGELVMIDIPISRYPTFLYPLGRTLWVATGWLFAVATFIHVLALLIVVPLGRRTRKALQSSVLIGSALLWVGGNFARILIVQAVGPPDLSTPFIAATFDGLTMLSLVGWMLFPALLLRHTLLSTSALNASTRRLRGLLFIPPIILGLAVVTSAVRGSIGPLPPQSLIAPVLFYVCCYVAVSTGLIAFVRSSQDGAEEGLSVPSWSRVGNVAVFLLACAGAFFVYDALPALAGEDDAAAGGFTVLLQLFSAAPVVLVSLATLQFGRFDAVLTRALAYVSALGVIFFAFVGGVALIGVVGPPGLDENRIVLGLWVVLLLLLIERLAQPVRRFFGDLFITDRQRARQRLNRFGDRIRSYIDPERLAFDTVQNVGEAFDVRSGVLFLRTGMDTPQERWVQASYQPEPPYFTQAELTRIWSKLQEDGTVWARNPELNESSLPASDSERLKRIGVALAVPVTSGRGEPSGALVLSMKSRRRAVFNLEDVEMLRALCAQLGLATERLGLIERERALIQESAEAQMAALRAQINPHFLFNALNTIAALIAEKPEEAENTVQHLAAIFRYVLQAGRRLVVPLSEERRLVRQYLAIEQARFGDSLQVVESWDEGIDDLLVPAFALQTLVENAVKHGIERKRGGGQIALTGYRSQDGDLVIEVHDSGVGIPALFHVSKDVDPTDEYFGIGLRNVADRLSQLYGQQGLLSIRSAPDSGTSSLLHIPQHEAQTVSL